MKKTLLSALAVALLLASTAPARAQDAPKPFAIVALAGYDELRNDVDFIGQLSDNPDLVKSLDGIVALFTQFQGLAGLDKSKPLGVSIATDGQSFQALGFVNGSWRGFHRRVRRLLPGSAQSDLSRVSAGM